MELVIFWTGNLTTLLDIYVYLSIYLTSYLVSIYLFFVVVNDKRMGYFEDREREGGGVEFIMILFGRCYMQDRDRK